MRGDSGWEEERGAEFYIFLPKNIKHLGFRAARRRAIKEYY